MPTSCYRENILWLIESTGLYHAVKLREQDAYSHAKEKAGPFDLMLACYAAYRPRRRPAYGTATCAHPAAPVIRTLLTLYDQPDRPLALETFTNIQDEDQRSTFAALSRQEALIILFYDEEVSHQLTKLVPQTNPEQSAIALNYAEQFLVTIPEGEFDFDRAKQAVMDATGL